MTNPYQLGDLLDRRNQGLYQWVSARIPVVLLAHAGSGWAQQTDGGQCRIYCNKSAYPTAAFAHELLHAKMDILGIRRPYSAWASESDDGLLLAEAVTFIFNQLSHHRFYEEFIRMGYLPTQFLCDQDADEVRDILNRDIPKLKKLRKASGEALSGLHVLMPYLCLKSPHDPDGKLSGASHHLRLKFDGLWH